MALKDVKKELNQMEKTEIITLISEIYKKIPMAKSYLDIFASGEIKNLAEKYKKEIEKYVYPSGQNMILRETEARKIIRDVKKMKIKELNIELELHYVECCLEVIKDYSYWDEKYYVALGKIFNDATNEIFELELENKYEEQINTMLSKASEYGIELI